MELKDTIDGMLSEDYKERFKAEYKQLVIRLEKLHNMITKYNNGTLSFEPTCPIRLLELQAEHMRKYRDSLEERATIEGVNLD